MRTRRSFTTTLGLALAAALAGASYAALNAHPAAAQDATPVTSTSAAAPGPSASAAAAEKKGGLAIDAYAWPTEASKEPKEDEWAGATELENGTASSWMLGSVTCTQLVLREWMRVTCTPAQDRFFGAVWGMAGDLSTPKAKFTLASELPSHKAPPKDPMEELTRKMGASATVTFQVKPGSALMLRIDHIGWDESYADVSIGVHPGMNIDVSWALGEKSPTISYF